MKPCKVWPKSCTWDGYGQVNFEGQMRRAHRVAYCLAHGLKLADIKGLLVRHTCDNPPCVEPTHLILGTDQDNVDDMWARGRQGKTGAKGSRNAKAKFTEEQVLEIRKRLKAGEACTPLALELGVSYFSIAAIKHRHTWKHI